LRENKGVTEPPPALHVSGRPALFGCWDEGFAAVYATLFFNLQKPDILSAIRYAHPAPSFQGVFLWDSAFIAQVWKPWDISVAEDVARAVIELRDESRLQHVVADFSQSAFTQPPLLAWSVEQLRQWSANLGDEEFELHYYRPLAAYNKWLYANRQHESGLFYWAHPYETGIDNSPRFSSRDESKIVDTRRLASPDLSAYMVLQSDALAQMADALGHDMEARSYRDQAHRLRELTNRLLWCEADGLYYDRNIDTEEFIRSKTIAALLPLWAGIPNESHAARLRDHIVDPASFNSPIPLPSVALDDADFAKDMWRGPVWINVAYAVILGLQRYGFQHEAAELTFRLADGVYRTFAETRRLHEFYDPQRYDIEELHRKKGNRWKHFTLGSKPCSEFVGWTGLVNTLVIEQLIGFQRAGGRRWLAPDFPKQAIGLGFSLRLPTEQLAMSFDVLADRSVRAVVRDPSGPTVYEIEPGGRVDLDAVPRAASIASG